MEVMQEETQQLPASESAAPPDPASDIDRLLQEYDQSQTAPEPDRSDHSEVQSAQSSPDQSLDDLIAGLSGETQKLNDLQAQVDSMRVVETRRVELEAFNKFADDLQKDMPSHVPPDYTRAKLEALAHNPEIALAWDYRNVDRRQANIELVQVQYQLNQLQHTPGSDPQQIQQLSEQAYRLQIAANSRSILTKATLGILNDAKKLPKPVSDDIGELKADIAQAMRGASMPVDFKEPPPPFSTMSDAELRAYTKRNFGF